MLEAYIAISLLSSSGLDLTAKTGLWPVAVLLFSVLYFRINPDGFWPKKAGYKSGQNGKKRKKRPCGFEQVIITSKFVDAALYIRTNRVKKTPKASRQG